MNKDTPSLGTSIEAAQINSRTVGIDSRLTSVAANSFKSKSETKSPASSSQSSSAIDRGGQANFPKFNYTTTGRYEGKMVGFAIEGQVLTGEEMQEVGLVNYIQFGYCGFGLYLNQTGPPDNRKNEIWIEAGEIAGNLPSGFDPLNGKFIASGGSGYVWALIVINETTGGIVSVSVQNGASIPEDTNTNFYYGLGYYSFSDNKPQFTNYGCGSVSVIVCRNWFTADPPYWNLIFNR